MRRLATMAAELAQQDNPTREQLFSTLEEMTMLDHSVHSTTGLLVYNDVQGGHLRRRDLQVRRAGGKPLCQPRRLP